MLDSKVVQFKPPMRDITTAQECEAGRRDNNRVVQFKPSMPDTVPARAMAADLMALVERHKHLGHEVIVENLVLQIIFYGICNHVSGFSLVARLCHEVHAGPMTLLAFQPGLQIGSLTACRVWWIGWTSKSVSTTVMNPPDAPLYAATVWCPSTTT